MAIHTYLRVADFSASSFQPSLSSCSLLPEYKPHYLLHQTLPLCHPRHSEDSATSMSLGHWYLNSVFWWQNCFLGPQCCHTNDCERLFADFLIPSLSPWQSILNIITTQSFLKLMSLIMALPWTRIFHDSRDVMRYIQTLGPALPVSPVSFLHCSLLFT